MVMERLLLVGIEPRHVAEVKVTKGSNTVAHVASNGLLMAGELLRERSGGRASMVVELNGVVIIGDPVVLCVQLADAAPEDAQLEALASYRLPRSPAQAAGPMW